ncbi:transposase [gut metagenome]|uniref:Transposase n=1 Tax=gut metagenome TaxID=749906 RepID=J9FSG5_9ZZZZ
MRSVALGRKNWLFINSDTSGEDNAVIMTLLRTCEILGIPPLKWLKEIVPHIFTCQGEADYKKLLPYNYKNFFSE